MSIKALKELQKMQTELNTITNKTEFYIVKNESEYNRVKKKMINLKI